jgi:GNAT superfamily N-acetyltransferase
MIRTATLADAPAIAQLHAASWRHTYRDAFSSDYLARDVVTDRIAVWTERLRRPDSGQYIVLSHVDGQTAGFGCAFASVDAKWGALLDNLHVAQAFQRRGIGQHLFAAIADWVKLVEPLGTLHLWVLCSNENAVKFYTALGGTIVGQDLWSPPGGGAPISRHRMAWNVNAASSLR